MLASLYASSRLRRFVRSGALALAVPSAIALAQQAPPANPPPAAPQASSQPPSSQRPRRGEGQAPEEVKPSFGAMREDRGTESRPYDLVKVHVRLKLDEKAKSFEGDVVDDVIFLQPDATEIWFDASDLKVSSAKINGALTTFRQEPNRLFVSVPAGTRAGTSFAVQIAYSGSNPKRGLYFIQPTPEEPDLHYEMWTQGESEDNRCWVPTWDYPSDRATFEGEYTVRDGLTVVSNGKLVETKPAGEGWKTWHYSLDFPFATYLLSICVGDYEKYVDTWRGIPVEYYVQKGVGEAKARRSFGQTPDMLEFYSSHIGVPYPYPKYSQVAVQRFVAGGMENISATTQTDSTLHDEREHLDRDSQGLVAHELAHQWWGDYLTCRTWTHLWLNEGFANFFEALYNRSVNGEDAFELEMRGQQRQACAAMNQGRARPLAESFFNRAQRGNGNNDVYVRGSSVLHMIRTQLGDEGWWKAMHHYCTKHAGQLVTSADLETAIEEATGQNLHWLFEEYVYLPGHPKFAIEQSYDADKKEVVLNVKQTQDQTGANSMVPIFKYPVPIEVTCQGPHGNGADAKLTIEKTIWITQKEQELRIPAPSAPLAVLFDKGNAMLKEVEWKKSAAELAFLAQNAANDTVARIVAVEKLPACDDPELARRTLIAVLGAKENKEIRAAAADGLAQLGGEATTQAAPPSATPSSPPAATQTAMIVALSTGVKDPESRVRRSCVAALGKLKDRLGDAREATTKLLAEALRTDLSYGVESAACEALGQIGGDAALVALRAATDFTSPQDRVGSAALRARLALEDKMAVDETFVLASGKGDLRRKSLGINALGAMSAKLLGARRDEAVELLMEAAQKAGGDAQRSAINSLGELKAFEAEELLKKIASNEEGPRFARFTAQRALQQLEQARKPASAEAKPAAPATVEELSKKVESLEKLIQDLQQQLKELRAALPPPRPAAAIGATSGG